LIELLMFIIEKTDLRS